MNRSGLHNGPPLMLNGSLRRHYVDCRQALRSVHLAGLIENRLLQTGRIWSFIRLAFRLALTRKGRTAADANSIDTERTIFVNNRADRPGLFPQFNLLGWRAARRRATAGLQTPSGSLWNRANMMTMSTRAPRSYNGSALRGLTSSCTRHAARDKLFCRAAATCTEKTARAYRTLLSPLSYPEGGLARHLYFPRTAVKNR